MEQVELLYAQLPKIHTQLRSVKRFYKVNYLNIMLNLLNFINLYKNSSAHFKLFYKLMKESLNEVKVNDLSNDIDFSNQLSITDIEIFLKEVSFKDYIYIQYFFL